MTELQNRERLGPIDILINNAGMAAVRSLDDITEEDFDRSIAVNQIRFLCTQAVLPGMRARHWGRVINLSSIGARIGAGSVSVAYGAAKAGVEGLTRGKPLLDSGVAARIPVARRSGK